MNDGIDFQPAQASGGDGIDFQPLASAPPDPTQVGQTPPAVAMKQDMYGPGLQDTTVNDLSVLDGARAIPSLIKGGAGLAAKSVGALMNAVPATENVLPTIQRIANNQTLKSFGGSIGQLRQMASGRGGREALDEAAQYARDKGLTNVWSTSIGREKELNALKDASGKTIGALRDEAGEGPKTSELSKLVQDKFGGKYGSGIYSGQNGEFQNALDEISKLSPVKEVPYSEQVASRLDNYPDSEFSDLNIQEPNPLYTNVPENIKPNLNTAPPLTKDPRMIDLGLSPKGAPSEPEFPLPYKNPMFLSDEPTLGRTAEVQTHPYENARHSGEEFDVPDYDVSGPPSHSDIAKKMTELNKYAEAQSGILRPNSATTDVTDTISARNNADIAQKLGSEKARQYVEALSEQSKLHPLEHLQDRGELRQAGSRGGLNRITQEIADRFGYRLAAQRMSGLHDALQGKPLSQYLPSLGKSQGVTVPHDIAAYIRSKQGKEPDED